MSNNVATTTKVQLSELVSNMEFILKNMEEFEKRNTGTKLVDDFNMDVFKLLAESQKAKKIVDSMVNTVFLYTPREKLQL